MEAFDLPDYEEIEVIRFSPYLPRPILAGTNDSIKQSSLICANVLLRYNSKNVSDEKTLHKRVHEALKHGALPIDANSIEISQFVPGKIGYFHHMNRTGHSELTST